MSAKPAPPANARAGGSRPGARTADRVTEREVDGAGGAVPGRDAVWIAGLFVAAAVYQLVVLLDLARGPFFGHPILDARYQVEWALDLAAGRETHAVFFQSPLYSYLLAGFLRVFGWQVWGIVLIQWAAMLAVGALVLATLRRLGVDRRVTRGAVAFVLFYPLLPFYASFFHKTALEILLHALVLFLMVRLVTGERTERGGLALAFVSGAVFGAAALVRSTFQLLLLLPMPFLSGRRALRIALLVAGFALPVGWATLHNHRGAGEWVPLQTSFGFNLFLGNNPWNPEGALMPVPGLQTKPLEEESSARAYAESQARRTLSVSGENETYLTMVRNYIRLQPDRFRSALGRKLHWYLHREELPDNESYRDATAAAPSLAWNPLHWGWVVLFTLPALLLLVASWRWRGSVPRGELVVLLYALSLLAVTMVFFVNSRFRVCHLAPWIVIAALGADTAIRHARRHRTAVVLAVGLGLLPAIAMLAQPMPVYPPDERTLKLCLLYGDLGELDRAEALARTLESEKTREAQLARIASLRAAPAGAPRELRLLSPRLPHR